MVADKLQRQEEERIQCSPTSNIDNMVEEEMDISTTHHKRKVKTTLARACILYPRYKKYSSRYAVLCQLIIFFML